MSSRPETAPMSAPSNPLTVGEQRALHDWPPQHVPTPASASSGSGNPHARALHGRVEFGADRGLHCCTAPITAPAPSSTLSAAPQQRGMLRRDRAGNSYRSQLRFATLARRKRRRIQTSCAGIPCCIVQQRSASTKCNADASAVADSCSCIVPHRVCCCPTSTGRNARPHGHRRPETVHLDVRCCPCCHIFCIPAGREDLQRVLQSARGLRVAAAAGRAAGLGQEQALRV